MIAFLAKILIAEVIRIEIVLSRMALWSGHVTCIVQKRNAISSGEMNPEVGANGMVQWRICSLPMELTFGSEFATDFQSSGA
jgi:hypothetical protein